MNDAFLKKSLAQFFIDINSPRAIEISNEEEEKMYLTDERDLVVSQPTMNILNMLQKAQYPCGTQ